MPERAADALRPAKAGEAPLLRPLWRECFGDGETFTSLYEQAMFRPDRVELAVADGEAVAMVTVLPACLHTAGGEALSAGCVYGVATREAHRGRGLATALLGEALRRRLGISMDCVAVVPDTPDLFPYYRRAMGAETAFYVRELVLDAGDLGEYAPLAPAKAEAEDYLARRRAALRGRTCLDWDRAAVEVQGDICRMEGGDLYRFPDAPGCCAAVERGEGGLLLVRELLAPEALLPRCLRGLLAAFGCTGAEVRLPAWSGASLGGRTEPFAMLTGLVLPEAEAAYLGFDFA